VRPLWTGSISFGLVNIPVGLYSATSFQKTIDLDLLRDSDQSRIRYRKVAEADGKEVPREHIVKGYQYEKGHYVVINEEDFKRVEIASTQMVDIKEFVSVADIDPRFFDQPYFLAPTKGGDKAYALLRTALEKTGLAGIAKVVIRPPREHLALVKALDEIIMMETLRFADELRDPGELQIPKADIGQKELEMAVSLINTMSDKWKPEKYHDEYRQSLMKVIEQKIKTHGKALPPVKGASRPAAGKVIDLAALLQESLGRTSKQVRKKTKRSHRTLKKAA
jgi:DNA end-binding protein Ku